MAKSVRDRFIESMKQPDKDAGEAAAVAKPQACESQSLAAVAEPGVKCVSVSLPLGETPTHVSQGPLRCDVRLTRHQSNILRRLAVGLDLQRAKTGDGRRVTEGNWRAALQWLLDQVEA